MSVSPCGANSALLGLTVTLWTVWQVVLTLNKCLQNTMERIYFHWYAVLMDLWNESHCIAAFLRQVLYLINAVHKLYNYTSICHCQIYTLLHTVRLRWFHFIAQQMDFWKCISLKFLVALTGKARERHGVPCVNAAPTICPEIKNVSLTNTEFLHSSNTATFSKCRLQPNVPFPHQEAPF